MRKLDSKPCTKCGEPVQGYRRTDVKRFAYPRHCPNCRGRKRGEDHPSWKGGRRLTPYGYIEVRQPGGGGPHADARGYCKEHHLVWEKEHGPIPKGMHIHHRNHDKTDNRLENLELISAAEHNRLHFGMPEGKWSRLYDACVRCGDTSREHTAHGLCHRCYQLKP